MIRIAITGTDTGVGKTVVAAALLNLLRNRGLKVAGMKPVETGVSPGDPHSDAAMLAAAAGSGDPLERVCPIVLPDPLAPWLAARRAERTLELEALDRALEELGAGRDLVVIEGAGGLLVPLTRTVGFDTLFRRWRAGLIIVALDRLGVLNHTLLTVAAARSAGLHLHGIVLNSPAPEQADLSTGTNAAALRELIDDLPVLAFPRLENPLDGHARIEAARSAGLDRLVTAAAAATNEAKGLT
jgi:dethiobiotin synthetase